MKFKPVALGAILVLSAAMPAFAARGQRHQPTFPVPQHLLMVPKLCDNNEFFITGGFIRFPSTHGQQSATWGAASAGITDLGVNVFPTGLPAKSFQVDWDLTNSVDPYICIYITTPPQGVLYWICDPGGQATPGGSGNINKGLATGFTLQLLSNGFTRITFDSAANGMPAGSIWNKIAFVDTFNRSAGQDTITNLSVNGIAVSADTHAPTNPPVRDCSE